MKIINLKHFNLRFVLIPCVLVCSLFASQQVLADDNDFVLNASDSSAVVAQGRYEELTDSIAKIVITMRKHQYSGTGVISKSLVKPAKDLRADRALMATKHKKHVAAELVADDGAKLACELNMKYGDIWGQCVDPSNQQIFTIKNSKKVAK